MGQQESNNSNDILWDIRDYLESEKKTLKDIFKDLDDDDNKTISVEEFKSLLSDPSIKTFSKSVASSLPNSTPH